MKNIYAIKLSTFLLSITSLTHCYLQTPMPSALIPCDQNYADFGSAVANAGDVNGDGYGDVIIGAYHYDAVSNDEGRVYVFLGSADGLDLVPNVILEGDQENGFFGCDVSSAGDINNDGYDDIVIGANWYDNGQTNEGRVYIYYGSSSGISNVADVILESNDSGAYFGSSVSGAGDVNNDGYDDIIIGAYGYYGGVDSYGGAFIYLGSAGGLHTDPNAIISCDQDNSSYASEVAGIGDINGDSFDDVAVGARTYDVVGSGEGRTYIYYGSAGGIDPLTAYVINGDQNYGDFGCAISSAGDINADGFSDIVVGAFGYDNPFSNAGRAYIYYGSMIGINPDIFDFVDSDITESEYGISVSGAGDFNGDGFSDVLIGADEYSNGEYHEGSAFLFLGSISGLITSPYLSMESDLTSAQLGINVSGGADINNDGFADVIVGANQYINEAPGWEGSVFVYNGFCPTYTYYADNDSDGFGSIIDSIVACNLPFGFVENNSDCDDTDENVYPGALEICNIIDDNCNGSIDEGLIYTDYYIDSDDDGFGSEDADPINACNSIPGYSINNSDCNDTDNAIHPAMIELCNLIDDDCNDLIDDDIELITYYIDQDEDSYGNIAIDSLSCFPELEGYVLDNSDCDDSNADIHPGATEILNLLDDDCDNQIDEGLVETADSEENTIFTVYPNPATDIIEIKLNYTNYNELVLSNAAGFILLKMDFTGDSFILDISNFSAGLYYLQIKSNEAINVSKFEVF